MPIRVQVPGHGIVEFPDGTSEAEMASALSSLKPTAAPSAQTAAPRTPAAAEDFMTPEQIANRDMTGMDIVKGAAKGLGRSVAGIADMAVQASPLGVADRALGTNLSGQTSAAINRATPEYTNDAQRLGGTMETAAEMAVPIVRGAQAINTVMRTGPAAAKFAEVAKAANQIPVDLEAPGRVALRIADLAQRGGGSNFGPAPVRQFIQWATDPKKANMTYEVAKDFASNISKLSSKEMAALPDSMKYQIHELRVVLNKAVGEAAAKAGKGREYAEAMTEFARAKKLQRLFIEGAKYALPAAGVTGGGMWLADKLAGGK